MTSSNTWHVLPVGDLIEHEDVGEDCVCVPEVTAQQRDDGSYGWIVKHHSLDGREGSESQTGAP